MHSNTPCGRESNTSCSKIQNKESIRNSKKIERLKVVIKI